jgi:hypothetical protein
MDPVVPLRQARRSVPSQPYLRSPKPGLFSVSSVFSSERGPFKVGETECRPTEKDSALGKDLAHVNRLTEVQFTKRSGQLARSAFGCSLDPGHIMRHLG